MLWHIMKAKLTQLALMETVPTVGLALVVAGKAY